MVRFLTLDTKGILLAFVVGAVLLMAGGNLGTLFVAVMLLFLVLAAIVTGIGKVNKQGIGVYESRRGWRNVTSNGTVPVSAAVAYWLSLAFPSPMAKLIALAYTASVCAITADKFASELGVLDGEPVMLLTLKHAKKGASGAVTSAGLAASLVGSAIIGLSAIALSASATQMLIVVVSGFLGNIIDSVMGYYENKGIGDKHTSNFFCSLAGFVLCLCLLLVLR